MSDTFEGPGYWMASDGKWYPPHRHPDPNYRAQFTPPPVPPPVPKSVRAEAGEATLVPPAVPDVAEPAETPPSVETDDTPDSRSEAESTDTTDDAAQFPTVELRSDSTEDLAQPTVGALSEIHRVQMEAEAAKLDQIDDSSTEPAVVESPASSGDTDDRPGGDVDDVRQSFSVGPTRPMPSSERPVFDVPAPRSVVGATRQDERSERTTNLELELDQPPPAEQRISVRPVGRSVEPSTSTALAVIPAGTPDLPPVSLLDRFLAAMIFCAGVAMIVGSFLDWTTGSVVQTGWERGDGIAAIVAGVVGSAAAGPIYVGFHHLVPKAIAIVCGLVGLVVIGLTAVGTLLDNASANTSIGVGFVVVLVASAAMTLAGVLHRVDTRY